MYFNIDENKAFPNLKKPHLCGYYSVNKHREITLDATNLKYYSGDLPNKQTVDFDLNRSFEQRYCRPEFLNETEKINHMLEYLIKTGSKHLSEGDASKLYNFDFITFRGLFTKLLCTPYERTFGWSISATYYKGNIYLYDTITEYKRNSIINASEKMKRCSSWGYKFEQYLLSDNPQGTPDASKGAVETEEFCCLFETKLNNKKIFYGAEIDGVISTEIIDFNAGNIPPDNIKFVELKTNRKIDNYRQKQNFKKHKLLSWWCQCFMVNIQDIIVGYRNDYGRVLELDYLNTKDIPKEAKDFWLPNVCMNFLDDILSFMKDVIDEDDTKRENDPYTVYQFEWTPPDKKISWVKHVGKTSYSFIPEWFIQHVNSTKVH